MSKKIKVGITQGDINGISYELIIKAFQDNQIFEFCTPIIYGSPKVAAYYRKALNINNFNFNNINSLGEIVHKKANLINCLDDSVRVELGKATQIATELALISLEKASDDLEKGNIDVLVTMPINKKTVPESFSSFTGHIKYFAERFKAYDTLSIMASDIMKVASVSERIPLTDAIKNITEENIIKKLAVLNKSLIEDFGIHKPRIAVLALNPQTKDSEGIAKEENEIIIPTIEKANKKGFLALGPYSAEEFFSKKSFKKFDAVLAMYHDQISAPFRVINFHNGVTYTSGLPIIRTNPNQSISYDIAGLNQASPNSLREAIYLACNIYKHRKEYAELTKNVLPSYEAE